MRFRRLGIRSCYRVDIVAVFRQPRNASYADSADIFRGRVHTFDNSWQEKEESAVRIRIFCRSYHNIRTCRLLCSGIHLSQAILDVSDVVGIDTRSFMRNIKRDIRDFRGYILFCHSPSFGKTGGEITEIDLRRSKRYSCNGCFDRSCYISESITLMSFKGEEKMSTVNIAIDGPAGAGKSTIARMVSAEMGYIYVDTGAMYRAVALYITENNIDDAEIENKLKNVEISLKFVDGAQKVFLGDRDVSELIRTPEISMAASRTSAIPAVRAYLFELQKKTARENNVIMDGRDIGTVVLPNADVKIFLTAAAEERASRRYRELAEKPNHPTYEEILKDIIQRDHQDMNRETAPLKQADDAVLVDTTKLTLEQSAETIAKIIKERI